MKRALMELDGTQHFRTDLIIISEELRQLLILDLCFGSDDKLAREDQLIRGWAAERTERDPKMGAKFWISGWFDDQGKLTPAGAARMPDYNTRQVFKHARYTRRYRKLSTKLLQHLGRNWTVQILPIAVGVVGLVPDYTRRHLERIMDASEVKALVRLFIQTTQRAAIQAYKAWRQERKNSDT